MPNSEAWEHQPGADPADRAARRDAAAELPALPYLRLTQRRAPPPDRRGPWTLLAIVVLVHLLVAWVAYLVLRPSFQERSAADVFSVNLLEPAAALPPPPPLLAPPPVPGAPVPPAVHYERPSREATKATLEGSKAPPLRLFSTDGQVLLAPRSPAHPAPAYSAGGLQASHIYDAKPLPYHATRFNKAWAPVNETLGQKTIGRALDKAIDKTTVKKVVKLPGGLKIQCALSPLMLLAGCSGMPPQPPPKNDDDIRLSLPPARTLTGKKVVLPSAAATSAKPPASD